MNAMFLVSVSVVVSSLFFSLLRLLLPPKPNALPPGPRPWALVGNLFDLHRHRISKSGKKPITLPLHAALASLSEAYGPLIHLRLGSQPLIVASSASAAVEVLKTQDRILSARHVPACYRIPIYSSHSLVWSPICDDRWKSLRTLCRFQLFSPPSLEAGTTTRGVKAREMVRFLREREGVEIKVAEVVFRTVVNMFGNTVFSSDIMELVGDGEECDRGGGWDVKKDIDRSLEIGETPNMEDFFPDVMGGWDPQGLTRKVTANLKRIYTWFDEIRSKRKEEKDDFLKTLICSGMDGSALNAFITDLFTAGNHTTTTAVEWAMAELIQKDHVMQKLKDELQANLTIQETQQEDEHETISITSIKESVVTSLPYLKSCIKEALRLHPPAPLLLPHFASSPCSLMNHTIPSGSVVMVNAWAIGRDPANWEDPLVFSPERFMHGTERDIRGFHFELIPFGAGRRACPGIMLAERIMSLVIASLVHEFDWEIPRGKKPNELCMEEKPGLTLSRKEPLVLIPRSKVALKKY